MEKVVRKIKLNEAQSDFVFWQSKSYQERLQALETIRQEYITWKYGHYPRLQRVYRVVKRK
ncbi:MAG: hypothetical protein E2O77_13540 [Caldithrix sp.]|nr:MAG: hypothetical protein E2O77_13540 [Caldithrix sp.]